MHAFQIEKAVMAFANVASLPLPSICGIHRQVTQVKY